MWYILVTSKKKSFWHLAVVFLLGLLSCAPKPNGPVTIPVHTGTEALLNPALKPFYHGVASGDPTQHGVILWTRITPDNFMKHIDVEWELATDRHCEEIVQSGTVRTSPDKDYTVHIPVTALTPGQYYYYRFRSLGVQSVIGRTRTMPEELVPEMNLAVVSCSNYEAGYFNAYGLIAEIDDIAAVVHLGDYIYEYGTGVYGNKALNRKNIPPYEIFRLNDYRTRYAQYHLDPDLMRLHQMVPFITIWDDHEIANNSYTTGAKNHQPEEGDYNLRKEAAEQAYYEWLPITPDLKHLYRSTDLGALGTLYMLDERLTARTAQASGVDDPIYLDSHQAMIGHEQLAWLEDKVAEKPDGWHLIGNQVLFSLPHAAGRKPNMDSWAGYPTERLQIINWLSDPKVQNVIFLTGDSHSSWAFEVPRSIADYRTSHRSLAVEFATPSITSANADESIPLDTVLVIEQNMMRDTLNAPMKYIDLHDHGYILLRIRPTEIAAEYRYVDRINAPSIHQNTAAVWRVLKGSSFLSR
ncbi:MAG: alkaline phosphatase D family protein [Saprospiraceae bacterium]|nr:alkaline phosphatase D family protein [Saprospiraceae bacterium]MCB9319161.1 alkaline phosphatase D family protein [Lewinellaceae bacterium]